MSSDQRKKRLQEDLRTLSQIDRRSSVLEIQYEGEMPDVYEFTFHGKGIRQGSDADAKIEFGSICHQFLPRQAPPVSYVLFLFVTVIASNQC